jgi:glycosyltransferase involved in cell wall biosynthesis
VRIALVAPPWYPVPPRGYGGIELVVHLLRSELKRLGHDVVVYGAAGSAAGVEVLAAAEWSDDLGNPEHHIEWNRHFTYLARVYERLRSDAFDVVHDHTRYPGVLLCLASGVAPVVVHTMHEPLRESAIDFLAELDDEVRIVASSAAQAATATALRVRAVVHNAVDLDALRAAPAGGDGYLLQIGRIAPAKGQHLAIEVARRTGYRLVLAGKVSFSEDGRYFEDHVQPHLGADVVYLENVSGAEKAELIARADAGIFPLQWSEPFGLAMAECAASGVPAIALARGAAPEVIDHGVTGFVADDVEGLVAAVGRLEELDRATCASVARERFSPSRMACRYLAVYSAE